MTVRVTFIGNVQKWQPMETECRLLAARGGEEVGVESMLLLSRCGTKDGGSESHRGSGSMSYHDCTKWH